MATGTVKWFKADKGSGFVVPDGGVADLFVRHRGTQHEAAQGAKGPEARNVTLASV